tara:strand:- start:14 stop:1150 length:1137 start_codon:yes stop_codon:yes gene_type:complete
VKFKNLKYITYQVFPNEKANTLQTVRMLESLSNCGLNVTLIFPDREKRFKGDDSVNSFYNVKTKFSIETVKHYLPFNRFLYFEKFNFVFSNFFWSLYAVNKVIRNQLNEEVFMTRTHWILYFLNKKNKITIFECHKYSKIDQFVLSSLKNENNVLLIFTNKTLRDAFNISKNLLNNSIILESAFDERQFKDKNKSKINKNIVFIGRLLRFNIERNIDFLIKAFSDMRLQEFKLKIVGGPNAQISEIKNKLTSKNVELLGHLSHNQAVDVLNESEIGILINPDDEHSNYYTSPIKYFEYERGGVKICSTNVPAHKNLPIQDNIYYFEKNDVESFVNSILQASKSPFILNKKINEFSYENRAKKLINSLARLEGLEPPTL